MPIVAFLHTHVLMVILFLILFLVKATLLLLNKRDTLARVRNKTKVLDIVFGTLILITGGYMLFQYNGIPGWLITKVVLVLAAIPLGIVGLKRESKVLVVLSLLIFLYVYGVSETKSLTMKKSDGTAAVLDTPNTDAIESGDPAASGATATDDEILSSINENTLANAKSIYVQVCATCHGEDGKKKLGGAPDLTLSNLSMSDRKNIINNGRGLMPGFGQNLTEQEVEAIAAYTLTLRNN